LKQNTNEKDNMGENALTFTAGPISNLSYYIRKYLESDRNTTRKELLLIVLLELEEEVKLYLSRSDSM